MLLLINNVVKLFLLKVIPSFITDDRNIEERAHRWSSGRILACHAGGPGSIPGRCKCFFVKYESILIFIAFQFVSLLLRSFFSIKQVWLNLQFAKSLNLFCHKKSCCTWWFSFSLSIYMPRKRWLPVLHYHRFVFAILKTI